MRSRIRRLPVVLHSIEPFVRAEAMNPYLPLLIEAIPPGFVSRMFSWRFALFGRYDLFHLQWPENLALRTGSVARRMRPLLIALLLVRLRLRRIPVVQTKHNLAAHEVGTRLERALVGAWSRRTAVWVVLTERTPTPPGAARVLVPHGHYRDWYAGLTVELPPEQSAVRLLYFGLIRPYKGVDELVAAVRGLDDGGLRLRILGAPWRGADTTALVAAAEADSRISFDGHFAGTAELAKALADCTAVVLPYRAIHNSGSLLLALSLGRPVIAPRSPVTVDLEGEFGSDWVRLYDAPLTGQRLLELARSRPDWSPGPGEPDLSARDWPGLGRALAGAYARALRMR